MSDNKPSFIKISPGAKVTGLVAKNNTMHGHGDFINNEGTLEDAELKNNRHFATGNTLAPLKKQWHEHWLGFIIATIFCGLVVAFCAYYFGWTK